MFIKLGEVKLKLSTLDTSNNLRIAPQTYLTANLLTFIVDVMIFI